MKLSKFNILFDHNDKVFLTNTFSKSTIELDKEHADLLRSGKVDLLNDNDANFLLENGFAVQDDMDEIGLLRYRANKLKNSKEEMEFVIAPTLACNFRCVYCFENPRQGCMTKETQKNVLKFIFRKTQSDENKRIHIIWFGGEPLLYPDIVIKMNSEIYNYCKANGKELKSDIITNGYLLSKELLDKFEECHIHHFQITLDGVKEIHDKRRMKLDGSGTFNKIYENLRLFKDYKFSVSIRANVDKNNISSFNQLEKALNLLDNNCLECSPALVEVSERHLEDIIDNCYVNEDGMDYYYGNQYIKKYYSSQKASDYGLRLFFCEAEHYHSFAIDELGNVYKCWNSLGVDKDILCTVTDTEYNPEILSNYFARDPFSEEDCKDCPYIPICAGGCVMQKKLHNNRNFCSDCKYTYIQSVKNEIDNA